MILKMARGSNPTAKEDCVSCQPSSAIDWDLLDSELNSCVSPLHELLCHNEISTTTAVEGVASEPGSPDSYLHDRVWQCHQTNAKHPNRKRHRTRPSRTTELRLAREKNQARTTFRDNPSHRPSNLSRLQTWRFPNQQAKNPGDCP